MYNQNAWLNNLNHASIVKVQYSSKWCYPLSLKFSNIQKIIKTHFYRLYSIMTGSKIIAGSHSKNDNYFLAIANVSLPVCCHIDSGMTNLRIFVEENVALLGAMTDKWVKNLSVVGIRN